MGPKPVVVKTHYKAAQVADCVKTIMTNRTLYTFLFFISFAISCFNTSNDFLVNYNYDFAAAIDDGDAVAKGVGFYYLIYSFSYIIDSRLIVLFLYSTLPVVQFVVFSNLIKNNKFLCMMSYIGLIFLAQSTYLLKMEASQILFLSAIYFSGLLRYGLTILSLLFHLQSFVVLAALFLHIPRYVFLTIIILIFYKFNGQIVSVIGGIDAISAYELYNDTSERGIERFNSVTLLLVFIYILVSFSSIRPQNNVSIICERIVDFSLVLAYELHVNPVVQSRILDFSWIFILLYIGQLKKLSGLCKYVAAILSVTTFFWGIIFVFNNVIYATGIHGE